MFGDDDKKGPDAEGPAPRRGDDPRPSNVPAHDRDAAPDRAADRRRPGSDAAAGPHAQPSLTNDEATPGAGMLPESGGPKGNDDTDADAATG